MHCLRTIPPGCRQYYVAAEEVAWDYAPLGGDFCSGALTNWTDLQAADLAPNQYSLGTRFLKARYVEYTDYTFTTPKQARCVWVLHLAVSGGKGMGQLPAIACSCTCLCQLPILSSPTCLRSWRLHRPALPPRAASRAPPWASLGLSSAARWATRSRSCLRTSCASQVCGGGMGVGARGVAAS